MRGRVPPVKRKPCAIPLCPALRKKGSYVCAAHAKDTKTHHNGLAKQPKAHKFGAIATTVDGIRFDSKAEAARWVDLQILERAGQIRRLERQPVFKLYAAPIQRTDLPVSLESSDLAPLLIGEARMDFGYLEAPNWLPVTEDVKGLDNALSRWKRKHVLLQYGVTVRLIR